MHEMPLFTRAKATYLPRFSLSVTTSVNPSSAPNTWPLPPWCPHYLAQTIFTAFFKYKFIYFWLHWVFIAARGLARRLSLVAAMGATLFCSARASHCGGFSCCGAWALGAQASVAVARGSVVVASQALERRLSTYGTRA